MKYTDAYCRVLSEIEANKVTVSPGGFWYIGGGAATPAEVRHINNAIDADHVGLDHAGRYYLTGEGFGALRAAWPLWRPAGT